MQRSDSIGGLLAKTREGVADGGSIPRKTRSRWVRFLMLTLLLVALVYVGMGAGLYFFQRTLLFVADKTNSEPSDVGLDDAEVHRLTAADGVKLVSWLARGDRRRLAIYFHGNGGSLAWRAETIETLRQFGLSVLAVEYRGYGGSEGSPSETGLMRDANAAYDYAQQLGYKPSQILLYGESLGSGVAVSLAARREVGGVILDSAYSSIVDVAADRYWMFPVRHLLRDTFRSDLLIARIKAPILMLHGTADEVVPFRFGRALFALAGSNATFVTINGAGHLALGEGDAKQRIRQWLAR